jgi:pyruvate/2-oxoglutarate/acetoin dehydrogenase E1 component
MEHAFDYLDAPVTRVCAADVPLPYAANLEALALPQAEHIVVEVCQEGLLCQLKSPCLHCRRR